MTKVETPAEFDPRRVGSYRPRIRPEHLRGLWLVKQRTGQPMTELVAEALEAYLARADRL